MTINPACRCNSQSLTRRSRIRTFSKMTNLVSCRSSKSNKKMRLKITRRGSQSSYMIQRCLAGIISSCITSSAKRWRLSKRVMTRPWKSLRWIRRLQKLSPNFWFKMKKIGPELCPLLECRQEIRSSMWGLARIKRKSSSMLTHSACHVLEIRMKWRRPSSLHACHIILSRFSTERGTYRGISFWPCWIIWILNHKRLSMVPCLVKTGKNNMKLSWLRLFRSLKTLNKTSSRRKRSAKSLKRDDLSWSLTFCINWWIVQLQSNYWSLTSKIPWWGLTTCLPRP